MAAAFRAVTPQGALGPPARTSVPLRGQNQDDGAQGAPVPPPPSQLEAVESHGVQPEEGPAQLQCSRDTPP